MIKTVVILMIGLSEVIFGEQVLKFEARVNEEKQLVISVKKDNSSDKTRTLQVSNELDLNLLNELKKDERIKLLKDTTVKQKSSEIKNKNKQNERK